MKEALKILKIISDTKRINLQLCEGFVGGIAYNHFGTPLPDSSLELALRSDAVLLGAVGGPQWESLDTVSDRERSLLGLRAILVFTPIFRPIVVLMSFWMHHS